MNPTDPRKQQLAAWLARQAGWADAELTLASADASFRRYFRARRADGASCIVMDAPPGKEDVGPYLHVCRLLAACGLHVPAVGALDQQLGFVLLEDLGDTHMLAALEAGGDETKLYGEALDELFLLQTRGLEGAGTLAPYDEATLRREMLLLPEWYCARHLGLRLDDAEHALLESTYRLLVANALAQPLVLVHRDYHSRNLMITAERSPGVIDFQDALAGPLTYDLVSLLKDCYVAWPRARVEQWVREYRARLQSAGFNVGDDAQFMRWFDLMGLQRHLKVLGIFARLYYRDGKSGYLGDLPRTLAYVRASARRYRELAAFSLFVEQRLAPGLAAANARALAAAPGARQA